MSYWRQVLTEIGWPHFDGGCPRSVAFTSCRSGQGVSTVAANVAITATLIERTDVLLVDCNFWRPSQARIFRIDATPGLTELLATQSEPSAAIHTTAIRGLSIVPHGKLNRLAVRDADRLPAVLKTLMADCDLLVCDFPPVNEQSSVIAGYTSMDRVVMVLQASQANSASVATARTRLQEGGVDIAGIVINKQKQRPW